MTIQFAEWILVLLGHVANSCVLFNFVHANSTPRARGRFGRKVTEKLILLFAAVPIMALIGYWIAFHDFSTSSLPLWLRIYGAFSAVIGGFFLARWAYRFSTATLPAGVKLVSSQWLDVQSHCSVPLLVGTKARLFGMVPRNQVTKLRMENWEFRLPRLPDALAGLRVCQLSDLHFTGMVGKAYFDTVIDHANAAETDLIVITGDIIDDDKCLDWIEESLSRLTAKYGVYYVLGNHDRRVSDQHQLRQRLGRAGLIDAADGKWHSLMIGNATLWLAGNELPWYCKANDLPRRDVKTRHEFSMLLSHSPDQIGWAVRRDFDLMFAGHTHGGQIRLPLVGPIIAPSRYGIKFAAGTYRTRNTMMHVSRGLSSDEPVRINCPPELGIFTLQKN